MSTFSSVIHKSSKKFAPKAVPRRNVQRTSSQNPTAPAPSPSLAATPASESGVSLSSTGAPLVELSTAPTSDVVSVSSTPSAINTRSTSLDLNAVGATDSSSRSLRIKPQTRGEETTFTLHERSSLTSSTIEAWDRATDSQAGQIPLVRSSAPERVKRAQPEIDETGPTGIPDSPSLRKKRKTNLHSGPAPVVVTSDRFAPSSEPNVRPSSSPAAARPRSQSKRAQQTEDLLQNATSQAATVSALADAIDGTTNSGKTRSRKRRQQDTALAASSTDSGPPQPGRSRSTRTRESTLQSAAAEIVAEAVGGAIGDSPRRRRQQTPEGAEDHQIEPFTVKMGELVKDDRLGKKGWREAKMQQVDWDEVKKQRKEALLEAQKRRDAHAKEKDIAAREPNDSVVAVVPVMTIIDGQITTVEASREVDRQAETEGFARDPDQPVRVENSVTSRVNQITVGRQRGVGPGTKWDDEMEQRFYRGLRMFGTDFMMISSMFPGLSRRHIKLKYVKEEKLNYDRIKRNLENREPVDLSEFEEMTDKVLQDPKKVQEEIAAEEKRIREEDEQRRAREDGEPHPEEETVLESIEQPGAETEEPPSDAEDIELPGRASTTENRFASAARAIVQDAIAPKKKRRQVGSVKKKDTSKRGKRPMEGVEERLGPIDEVTR